MQKSLQKRTMRAAGGAADGRSWLTDLIGSVQLTPKGEHVALLLTKNPRAAAFMPASQLAKEIGINTATVVRFAQTLGFSGWKEFQLHFRHRYLAEVLPSEMARARPETHWDSPFDAVVQQDVANLQAALSTVDRDVVANVVRTLDGARKTLVLSSGSYSAVAHVLVHKMNVMGYDARLETRGGIHAITSLSSVTADDCVVAISFLRLVRHVVVGCEEAARRGITTVAITDSVFSPLARTATYTLMVPTESISWFQSLTAAVSVINGIASELHAFGGQRVDDAIKSVEELYGRFDVLYQR
jgi:DNA-binding MurR/RpiR family transcriptional regulator